MAKILIEQEFPCSVEVLFSHLEKHENIGLIANAKICRLKPSDTQHENGVNSIRRIQSFPLPSFEETIVQYIPNQLIEYTVTKGSPVKNHLGRMSFSRSDTGSHLTYSIELEAKTLLKPLEFIIIGQLENTLKKGLKKLAKQFTN